MKKSIEQRIEALEAVLGADEWEDIELRMIAQDSSKAGCDKPERLIFVVKSGSPTKQGRAYYRQEDETEEVFLARIEREEIENPREFAKMAPTNKG